MKMQVLSLASLSGLRIWLCCELWYIGHRPGSDLVLLWLWHNPAAAAPIHPLAWEHLYAVVVVALKRPKKKKKKRERERENGANSEKEAKSQERQTFEPSLGVTQASTTPREPQVLDKINTVFGFC